MSTEIKTLKGSWHKKSNPDFTVEHGESNIHLTRFFAGKKGSQIQITISQQEAGGKTSYIHLTKEQCKELGQTLIDCFDYNKYPSE